MTPAWVRPMAPNFSFQECSTRRAAVDNRRPVGQRSISGIPKSIASSGFVWRRSGYYAGCSPHFTTHLTKETLVPERLAAGTTAPDFTLQDAEGRDVRLR